MSNTGTPFFVLLLLVYKKIWIFGLLWDPSARRAEGNRQEINLVKPCKLWRCVL